MQFTFTSHFYVKFCRKSIHTTHSHTMQTSRNFVTALVKFTTSMKNSHYHFKSRTTFFFVHIHRNTTTIIFNRNRIIFMNCYINRIAITSKCFVDRVIYHLINQMMQTLFANIPNIHRRTLTHRF